MIFPWNPMIFLLSARAGSFTTWVRFWDDSSRNPSVIPLNPGWVLSIPSSWIMIIFIIHNWLQGQIIIDYYHPLNNFHQPTSRLPQRLPMIFPWHPSDMIVRMIRVHEIPMIHSYWLRWFFLTKWTVATKNPSIYHSIESWLMIFWDFPTGFLVFIPKILDCCNPRTDHQPTGV